MQGRAHPGAIQLLDDASIGLEARAGTEDHLDIRVWLRLLACSNQIQQEVRSLLRTHFGTTLPRFDYLAQLERHPEGLRMNALSRYMMVSGGNVTGLTDQLVADGWIERIPDPEDRRSWRVRLLPLGHAAFADMAREHELWLGTLFEGLSTSYKQDLYKQLGRLRVQMASNLREASRGRGSSGAAGQTERRSRRQRGDATR
jgi:DNA-binding MarR family transcriptional regulator